MEVCSECGTKTNSLHSNGHVGFEDLCDQCQLVAHGVFNANRAKTIAARIAAKLTGSPSGEVD